MPPIEIGDLLRLNYRYLHDNLRFYFRELKTDKALHYDEVIGIICVDESCASAPEATMILCLVTFKNREIALGKIPKESLCHARK